MLTTSNPRASYVLSSEHPTLPAPEGRPLIVHVVVNIEYWPYDQLTPRTIVIPPHGQSQIPDLPNFCWSEYGNRCGMPRLIELFDDRSLPVTASINASVIDVYPALAEAILKAGWEFVGHGMHQRSQGAVQSEGEMIAAVLERLNTFTGRRCRGWMSPGWSETFDTLDHLSDNGIEYVCQWVIDDIPVRLKTIHGPLVALPYGLDLNDSVVYAIEKHSSDEMRLRISETVSRFECEIARHGQPRVLTIPLHPHLSGVAHRMNFLEQTIDALLARSDAIFMNGGQLLDWYNSASLQKL